MSQTTSDTGTDLEPVLCGLAVDYWKLLRAYERLAAETPDPRGQRLMAQARYADARLSVHLEGAGLLLATFEGQEITPQIPVVAINADDLGGDDRGENTAAPRKIVVGSTLEPAVVAGARVLAMGRVIAQEEDA